VPRGDSQNQGYGRRPQEGAIRLWDAVQNQPVVEKPGGLGALQHLVFVAPTLCYGHHFVRQFPLAPSGKSVVHLSSAPLVRKEPSMPVSIDQPSELVEISKLNGDFKKNYGILIGAYLYLRSVSAARGRSFFWTGLISMVWSVALAWSAKHALAWLHG
jgi:hypothetical protein